MASLKANLTERFWEGVRSEVCILIRQNERYIHYMYRIGGEGNLVDLSGTSQGVALVRRSNYERYHFVENIS